MCYVGTWHTINCVPRLSFSQSTGYVHVETAVKQYTKVTKFPAQSLDWGLDYVIAMLDDASI